MTYIRASFPLATFSRSGVLTVATGQHRFQAVGAWTLTEVYIRVGTNPAGASVIVDVNINGTTIFTTQANRPAIPAGSASGNSTTFDVSTITNNNLSVDIDQIGSTTAGSDLTVVIYARPAI